MPNRMTNMAQNHEIILININGADRPGVTAALTEILAKNNAVILDIGQADTSITIYHWVSCFKARKEIPAIY